MSSYEANKLYRVIDTSKCCKARLLHYFARNEEEISKMNTMTAAEAFSSWCGWHNDHGSLTGLVSAMYFDENHNPVENTDSTAG